MKLEVKQNLKNIMKMVDDQRFSNMDKYMQTMIK